MGATELKFKKTKTLRSSYYYIWSFEHNAWWRPNELGYTKSISEAGIYQPERAHKICLNANITGTVNEVMVPVPYNEDD